MIHNVYTRLPFDVRSKVDDAFDWTQKSLASDGLDTSTTDAAEKLVEAISQYVVASNPEITLLADGASL